jgi:hypothetical protein
VQDVHAYDALVTNSDKRLFFQQGTSQFRPFFAYSAGVRRNESK